MCVHVCVHLFTFSLKKTSPQKLLTGLLTDAQAPLVLSMLDLSNYATNFVGTSEKDSNIYRRLYFGDVSLSFH